jgi:RNA polymerase sigma factor (sigma-70 family)
VNPYHAASPMAEVPAGGGSSRVDTTFELLERVKGGDAEALDQVFARYLPALRRWASGRLPRWTRDLMSTDDLVQETFIRAMKGINRFEMRHEGALHGYLRQAIVNRVRDEVRRGKRAPALTDLNEHQADHDATPLELAIGEEALQRYEAALTRLREEDREAVVARVEMGLSYQEIAEALGKPTAEAARMAVSRALMRLAREMEPGNA